MSKVQQRAGGGKVTVEGLTADVVQAGNTVTVKQGSKVVQEVRGSYLTPIRLTSFTAATSSGAANVNLYFDVSEYSHLVLSGWGNWGSVATLYLDGTADALKTSSQYSEAGKSFSRNLDITNVTTVRIYLLNDNTARIDSLTIT